MTPLRCPRCYLRVRTAMVAHVCSLPESTPKPKTTKKRRFAQTREEYLASVRVSHGTRRCYQNGCRNPECKAAEARYQRERKAGAA